LLASLGSKGKNRNSLACLRNAGSYSAESHCSHPSRLQRVHVGALKWRLPASRWRSSTPHPKCTSLGARDTDAYNSTLRLCSTTGSVLFEVHHDEHASDEDETDSRAWDPLSRQVRGGGDAMLSGRGGGEKYVPHKKWRRP